MPKRLLAGIVTLASSRPLRVAVRYRVNRSPASCVPICWKALSSPA